MSETNKTEPKLTFPEIIIPLARKYNELVTEDRHWVGGEQGQRELRRKKSETYDQMIDATSKAILDAAYDENRKLIIDSAIDAFATRNSTVSVSEQNKRTFLRDMFLKTVGLAESRSSQTPQK